MGPRCRGTEQRGERERACSSAPRMQRGHPGSREVSKPEAGGQPAQGTLTFKCAIAPYLAFVRILWIRAKIPSFSVEKESPARDISPEIVKRKNSFLHNMDTKKFMVRIGVKIPFLRVFDTILPRSGGNEGQ